MLRSGRSPARPAVMYAGRPSAASPSPIRETAGPPGPSLAAVHGPGSAGALLRELSASWPVMSGVARALFGNWLDAVVYDGDACRPRG